MKRVWKRLLAIAMATAMLTTLPGMSVFAEDITSNESTETVTETAVDSTETVTETAVDSTETVTETAVESTETTEVALPEAGTLNYVYVEEAEVFQNAEQAIVVSVEGIGEKAEAVQDIRLGYQVNGEEKEVSYSELVDNMIVFRQNFEEIGTYELQYIEIQTKTDSRKIIFADNDIEVSFLVNEALEEMEEPMLIEDVPVTVTGDGLAEVMTELIPQNAGDGQVVVVLDPGHDSLHCGAAGNGLREEVLTLKIAQYCKEELEQYRNVTVYMTRNDGSCLDTSSNGNCMKARCNFAASVGADVLVSIHVDAGSLTGTGAMAIVAKNGVYRDDLSMTTQAIGQKILDELSAIGLASRGLYIRMSDSPGAEYQYPNGAVADWYAITRDSIKVGVPGIIMEHGFISNPSDVANYLNSDEKLKALGVADATGIAKYFGLSKSSAVTEAMRDDSTELYTDTAENISGFIAALYESVLDRTPSRAEVSWWLAKVEQDQLTGIGLARYFVNSEEFQSRNYSNEEYVEKLYEVFLGRASDSAGKAYWVSALESGTSRIRVAEQIGNSPEFELVCARYGIAQGNHSMQYVKLYPKIADFVTEYYNGLMGREPDSEGLEYWTKSLIQGNNTASDITKGFINSPEFRNLNLSKSDFVEGLYETYLGRSSDAEGKAYWTGRLNTMSQSEKEAVIRGFIRSEEYKNHCDSLGIAVGNF